MSASSSGKAMRWRTSILPRVTGRLENKNREIGAGIAAMGWPDGPEEVKVGVQQGGRVRQGRRTRLSAQVLADCRRSLRRPDVQFISYACAAGNQADQVFGQ